MSLWGNTDTSGDEPKFAAGLNANTSVTIDIYGVDNTEVGVANTATGDARKYAPAHGGWVGITTYVDMHNNLRVKTETLVALNIESGDQSDDTVYPDTAS